jgi:hypothetical protein
MLAIATLSGISLAGPAAAAQADVPNGRAFSDLASFSDISCVRDGAIVARDLIVNPGGGNVAWLPDGTLLVGTSFAMYDEQGQLLFVKTYGATNHQSTGDTTTCTSTGTDPDSGASVTVVFTASARTN